MALPLALLLLTTPVSGLDDSPTATAIEWQAPPGCPDAAAVRSATERLLGEPLSAFRTQRVRARALVHRNGSGHWELALELTSPGGAVHERLVAVRCAALADVVALKVALAVDPFAFIDVVEKPRPIEKQTVTPKAPPPFRAGVRPMVGTGFGPLPPVSPGVALFGSIQWAPWRAELGGQYWFARDVHYEPMPDIGVELQLMSGLARFCAVGTVGRVELPVCAGAEVGAMRGEGFGLGANRADYSLWAALVTGPAVAWPVTRNIALWLEIDAILPLFRPGFRVRDFDSIYRAPPGAARTWAGMEFRFP
jgi:hypothetical protein